MKIVADVITEEEKSYRRTEVLRLAFDPDQLNRMVTQYQTEGYFDREEVKDIFFMRAEVFVKHLKVKTRYYFPYRKIKNMHLSWIGKNNIQNMNRLLGEVYVYKNKMLMVF